MDVAEPVGGVAEVVPVVDVLDVLDAEAAVARDVEPVAGELVRAVVPLHDRLRGAERLARQSHLHRIIFLFSKICAMCFSFKRQVANRDANGTSRNFTMPRKGPY